MEERAWELEARQICKLRCGEIGAKPGKNKVKEVDTKRMGRDYQSGKRNRGEAKKNQQNGREEGGEKTRREKSEGHKT